MMQIKYTCPFWGCENDSAETFIDKVKETGYDGIEINLPQSGNFTDHFIAELEDIITDRPDFIFIAQQLSTPVNKSVDDYIGSMAKNLKDLTAYQPTFINSHTGKDYYSFDDNCRVIEAALNVSSKTGVRILHETHRGRFSFHAASLIPYLDKFPEIELVGDFSHFCTVSESLFHDQEESIKQIMPHVSHIHARVGSEQSPQVADPFAQEWSNHLQRFVSWWQEIIRLHKNQDSFSVTPEAGPLPYMPSLPFTQQPLADQWSINIKMKNYLTKRLR